MLTSRKNTSGRESGSFRTTSDRTDPIARAVANRVIAVPVARLCSASRLKYVMAPERIPQTTSKTMAFRDMTRGSMRMRSMVAVERTVKDTNYVRRETGACKAVSERMA